MEKKIVGIFVCTLLIAAAVLPVAGTENVIEDDAPSSGLATITASCEMADVQWRNDGEGLADRATPFYAYVALDPTGGLTVGPCSFLPTAPGTITSLAPTSSTDFISGGTWAAGTWYGCEYAAAGGCPVIWIIDNNTGAMTLVGSYDPCCTGLSFNGLAYDPTTGIMYGCNSTDLYTVNMVTGVSTWVGSFGINGSLMIGIAFDGSGNLYGAELVTDFLYSINPANGLATPIGTGLGININFAQDMAFDLDTGILYLSAFTMSPIYGGHLYTCNPATGAATLIGAFQNKAVITGFAIPYNLPPNKPSTPSGPTSGKAGVSYTYSSSTTDPNGDQIFYNFSWGDNNFSGWVGPFLSGQQASASHTWGAQGAYQIKVKAKDTPYGAESPWSDSLSVTMPKNKALNFNFNLLSWLFERFPNAFPILRYLIGL